MWCDEDLITDHGWTKPHKIVEKNAQNIFFPLKFFNIFSLENESILIIISESHIFFLLLKNNKCSHFIPKKV